MARRNISKLWNYFTKYGDEGQAICQLCNGSFSYKATIGNLKTHLKRKHPSAITEMMSGQNTNAKTDDDDNSISSVKFSSEIWALFEQENESARCSVCQKTCENTVEEMRNHLEDNHPAVLIKILRKEAATSDREQSDDENPQEDPEDSYTEIVYLEEEPPVKRSTPKVNPLKRRQSTRPHLDRTQETSRLEYKITNNSSEPAKNPEPDHIDPFLNYIKVLLKSVPKDSFPKLQLDIISMVLNAQMTAPQPLTSISVVQQTPMPQLSIVPQTPMPKVSIVPQTSMPQVSIVPQTSMPQVSIVPQTSMLHQATVPSVGSMVTVTESEETTDNQTTHVNSIASTADYHITIESKENSTT